MHKTQYMHELVKDSSGIEAALEVEEWKLMSASLAVL